MVSKGSMARVRSNAAFRGSICSWNDIQVVSKRLGNVSYRLILDARVVRVDVFQLFKTCPYIQRKSSSRATPDFPREDDNRHYQVLFHLHARAIRLWLW